MYTDFATRLSKFSHLSRRIKKGKGIRQFCEFQSDRVDQYGAFSYVIPFVSEQDCLVTRRYNGRWVLPGGTLEPGEDWLEAAHRELLEETGSRILEIRTLGMYDCISGAQQPHRTHLPHPEHVRVVSWANVEIIQAPSDPDKERGIAEVKIVHYQEASKLFVEEDRDLGQLYLLAYKIKANYETEGQAT